LRNAGFADVSGASACDAEMLSDLGEAHGGIVLGRSLGWLLHVPSFES